MSNMKNLLGDMTYEEFEVKRKEVLEKLKSISDGVNEPYSEDGRQLYNYWLEVGGRELIHKWVNDRGGYILESEVDDCLVYMFDSFVAWLESFE